MVSFLRESQTVQLLGQDKGVDGVCLQVAPLPPDSRSGPGEGGQNFRGLGALFLRRRDAMNFLVSWGKAAEGNKARVTSVLGYSADRLLG